ncbi:MAG: hypothetical protein ACI9HB_003299, partial [Gammaproteobacteria bacterium]
MSAEIGRETNMKRILKTAIALIALATPALA